MTDRPPTTLPKTIPYHLSDKIRDGIITGRYPPGSPLREQTLEKEYGASRGPVREALRLLELRGLAVHEPRRGFRVREYSPAVIEDIYRLRAALEGMAVDGLKGHDLRRLVAALEESNAGMRACQQKGDIHGYLQGNLEFHDHILAVSGNEPLTRSLGALNEMAQPLRYALLRRRLEKSGSVRMHGRIIGALAAGDLAEARALMEAHILENLDSVKAIYRSPRAA